jgi:hypothetical protein
MIVTAVELLLSVFGSLVVEETVAVFDSGFGVCGPVKATILTVTT